MVSCSACACCLFFMRIYMRVKFSSLYLETVECGPVHEGSSHLRPCELLLVPFSNSFCREQQWGVFDSETMAAAAQVPCGNSFHQELQWVATPAGEGRARLVVSARVVFLRPLFGMRGLIESSSLEARNSRLPVQ